MSDLKQYGLAVTIDAAPAEAGANRFKAAINAVKKAVSDLDRQTDKAFANLDRAPKINIAGLDAAATKVESVAGMVESAAARMQTALQSAFMMKGGNVQDQARAAMAAMQGIQGVAPSIAPRVDLSALRGTSTATAKLSDDMRRVALSAESAIRISEQATQRLVLRMNDLGNTAGVDTLNAALDRLKTNLASATSVIDVRSAKSQFDNLRSSLLQTTIAAEYHKGELSQMARMEAEAANAAARHAAERDNLRAKYVPLFAVSKQYEATLAEIDNALRQNILTEKQAEAARQNAANAMAGISGTGRAASAAGFAFQNAAYQVGDFAVQIAAGTSASRALAMQLPQLLGGFGIWGAAAGALVAILGALWPTVAQGSEYVTITTDSLNAMASQATTTGAALNGLATASGTANGASENLSNTVREQVIRIRPMSDVLNDVSSALNSYRTASESARGGTAALGDEFGRQSEQAQRFYVALSRLEKLKLDQGMREGVVALGQALSGVTDAMGEWDYGSKLPEALRPEALDITSQAAAKLRDEYGLTLNQARKLTDAVSAARLAKGPTETAAAMEKVVSVLLEAQNAGAQLPPSLIEAAESAVKLGMDADRMAAVIEPLPGLIGSATAQTNSWAAAMGGVAAQVGAVLSSLSRLSGGVISRAGANAELAALNSGKSIADAAAERQRAELQLRLDANQMAANARGPLAGRAQGILNAAEMAALDAQLAQERALDAARTEARKRETASTGGGSARTTALNAEGASMAEVTKKLKERTLALTTENTTITLLTTGQAQTREGATLLAEAMSAGGGSVDEATKALLRQYEALVMLNKALERETGTPFKDWLDQVPSSTMALKELGVDAGQAFRDGLTSALMGEKLDAKGLVDNLRKALAGQLSGQIFKGVFGGKLGEIFGPANGPDAMQAGIVQGSQQGAQIMAAAIAGAASGVTGGAVLAPTGGGVVTTIGGTGADKLAGAANPNLFGGIQTQLTAMLSNVFGGGGVLSLLFNNLFSSILGGLGGLGGGLLSLFGLSEGGYSDRPSPHRYALSPAVFHNAPRFKEGGLSDGGIPAVLHPNEAVVPLSRGRKIPVDLGKGGGDGTTINNGPVTVSVKVEHSGDMGDPEQATRAAKMIGEAVRLSVQEEMANHTRYGGLLNPRG